MSPIPGWYTDPGDAAQLRWWNGSTWTDDTRAPLPHTAPPPPGGAPTPPTPPTPPTAPPTPPPTAAGTGPTGGWTTGAYGAPGGGPGGSGTAFTYGFGGAPAAGPATASTPPVGVKPDRSWLSWASIGAAIAVALAVIVVLSVSLLGHKSNVPSSQGLAPPSNNPGASNSSTSTTPTTVTPTTLVPIPTDSTLFTDPAGVYSISVNTAWEPPPTTIGGIQLWYLTGVNYGGVRSRLAIVTQGFPNPISLSDFVQQYEGELRQGGTNFHLEGATPTTLDDGTAASMVTYSISELGETIQGETLVTVKGTHAVAISVAAEADAASTTFSLVAPYLATLHLN